MFIAVAFLVLVQVSHSQPIAPPAEAHLVHQSRLFALPDRAVGYVPASAGLRPPLLVLLHGAGHRQAEMVRDFEAEADERGIVLLAPDSRGSTWDAVSDAEGPPDVDSPLSRKFGHRFSRSRDADRVEAAISALATILPVDRKRTALAGFSDGATFALAMGMSRDHDFSAVIAWSPGIAIETENPARGRKVLVSHGRQDALLKFSVTCGDIVPLLRSEGGDVSFLPFDGGHDAPTAVKDAFLDAVFGPLPGKAARPLPTGTPTCLHSTADLPFRP